MNVFIKRLEIMKLVSRRSIVGTSWSIDIILTLPATGYIQVKIIEYIDRNGEYEIRKDVQHKNENQKGYYWASTSLNDETKACCLVFSEERIDIMSLDKSYKCSICMICLD